MASDDPHPPALAVLCAGLFALERRGPEGRDSAARDLGRQDRPGGPDERARADEDTGGGTDPAGVRRAVLGRAAAAFAVLCVTVVLAALRG
ncbi:hypothetical protein [Streptomyces coffeae]|uniref:Uncharacterized protein n=1 Tax=Streptomyces coffeae TaxID=621382 RepID=A0ABS1NJF5_9ACTN|nr:hypothetical protein [Streptomyces coffeae]MBL1100064.1 hypothetical protein [Streptomyces coffeae]